MWVLLLDLLNTGTDPYLSALSTLSFFLYFEVTTSSWNFCDFSVLLTVYFFLWR